MYSSEHSSQLGSPSNSESGWDMDSSLLNAYQNLIILKALGTGFVFLNRPWWVSFPIALVHILFSSALALYFKLEIKTFSLGSRIQDVCS